MQDEKNTVGSAARGRRDVASRLGRTPRDPPGLRFGTAAEGLRKISRAPGDGGAEEVYAGRSGEKKKTIKRYVPRPNPKHTKGRRGMLFRFLSLSSASRLIFNAPRSFNRGEFFFFFRKSPSRTRRTTARLLCHRQFDCNLISPNGQLGNPHRRIMIIRS